MCHHCSLISVFYLNHDLEELMTSEFAFQTKVKINNFSSQCWESY